MIWCHDGAGAPIPAPPRLQRYLEGHRDRLEGRSGWRPGRPLGCVFRLGPHTLGPKVAWHDLSDTLRAVALPATVRDHGIDRQLVPLNTVYFVPVPDPEDAVLLAGILNSLPVRVLARSIAERAKDARFRFFAWTVASIPLPDQWRSHPASTVIRRISHAAHRAGGIDEETQSALDRAAARLYGLSDQSMEATRGFDHWLRGSEPGEPLPVRVGPP